jgi:hypothetical protein
LFVCPARQIYREELDQFFIRDDIVDPYSCVMSMGTGLTEKEARELQTLVERFLLDTGLAASVA